MKNPEATTWRVVAILSVVSAGAYIGNEAARYFWDLTAYVGALDSLNPYRFEIPYPFLYPPAARDLFLLARSHLFELLSIAYVAALWLLLRAFARLHMRRRFEWLLAITAMGGLGVTSLLSGNIAVLMNLSVLALALEAAMGKSMSLRLLPMAIGLGALIKPQFVLYLGLLPLLDRSRMAAVVKALAVCLAVACVHSAYVVLRPNDWAEYVQAIVRRTTMEKDFGWGPAGFIMHFSDSTTAAFAAYVIGFLIVGGLSFVIWQNSVRTQQPLSRTAVVSLAFVVLTFANPRMPLYDLFAAAIALSVCCGMAHRASSLGWVLALALTINLVPWSIAQFARTPAAYPWWVRDLQITHFIGILGLLTALSRDSAIEGE